MSACCFKCERLVDSSMVSADEWEAPNDASVFDGGYTFGSRIYDALVGGIAPRIIVCDECLRAAKGTDRLHEIPVKKAWEK